MRNDPFGGRVSKEAAFRYKELFESEAGRIVLMDLAARFHLFETTYKRGETDRDSQIKEGSRAAVLHIFATAEVDPDQLLDMARKEIVNGRRH